MVEGSTGNLPPKPVLLTGSSAGPLNPSPAGRRFSATTLELDIPTKLGSAAQARLTASVSFNACVAVLCA